MLKKKQSTVESVEVNPQLVSAVISAPIQTAIQPLALDFGREDLNQLVAKLNEVIKRL